MCIWSYWISAPSIYKLIKIPYYSYFLLLYWWLFFFYSINSSFWEALNVVSFYCTAYISLEQRDLESLLIFFGVFLLMSTVYLFFSRFFSICHFLYSFPIFTFFPLLSYYFITTLISFTPLLSSTTLLITLYIYLFISLYFSFFVF